MAEGDEEGKVEGRNERGDERDGRKEWTKEEKRERREKGIKGKESGVRRSRGRLNERTGKNKNWKGK